MQSGVGRRKTGHGVPAHSFLCRLRMEAALTEEWHPRPQGTGEPDIDKQRLVESTEGAEAKDAEEMSDEERIKQTADFLRAKAEEDTEQKEERHKRSSPPEESSQKSKRKKVGPTKRNKTEDADEVLSKEESPGKKTKLGEQMKVR